MTETAITIPQGVKIALIARRYTINTAALNIIAIVIIRLTATTTAAAIIKGDN